MKHPAREGGSTKLARPWAGVVVRQTGKALEIQPGVSVMRAGTLLAPLDAAFTVVDPESREVTQPVRGFWVTTETFAPFHMICDGLPSGQS